MSDNDRWTGNSDMVEQRPRYPDPIAYIYAPFPILSEDVNLDPEDPELPEVGEAKARALDGFLFVKNGHFVYPTRGRPKQWWKNVLAYGYTAALSGPFKHFIWAGEWDEDFQGKHLEVVILDNLVGLSKDRSPHWRKNTEQILWLETEQGFVYALLEPAKEFDRGAWTRVTESWTRVPRSRSHHDPSFKRLSRQDPRPKWWGKDGDKAWRHWVGESGVSVTLPTAQTTLSSGSWAVGRSTPIIKPTVKNSNSSATVGAQEDAIVDKPTTSRENVQKMHVEPIYVESSDEETSPATDSSSPTLPSKVNSRCAKGELAWNLPGGSTVGQTGKRRVFSGASEPGRWQKQKRGECIDLTSDGSDGEQSQPELPSSPRTPPDATEGVIGASAPIVEVDPLGQDLLEMGAADAVEEGQQTSIANGHSVN